MNTKETMENPMKTLLRGLRASALTAITLVIAPGVHADNSMVLREAAGSPGETDVPVVVAFTSDETIQGYSVALEYDSSVITCVGASEIGGYDPEYFNTMIDEEDGTVVLGAILSLEPGSPDDITASPTASVDMVEFLFDVSSNALPGEYEIELVNGIATPPVNNVFSRIGNDVTLDSMTSEMFSVTNPIRFYFADFPIYPGIDFSAELAVEHPFDLEGMQIEIGFDTEVLELESITTDGIEALLLAQVDESSIEFLDVDFSNVFGNAEVAMIFDVNDPLLVDKVIPAGDHNIVEFHFSQVGTVVAGDETTIEFTNDGLLNLVTYLGGQVGLQPILENLYIEFAELPDDLLFIRGAINTDGLVNVADAIFLLQFIFLDGSAPRCFKSADFTDNGSVDIADAISILQWLFSTGDGPGAPYPSCGLDPSSDVLTCLIGTSGCN